MLYICGFHVCMIWLHGYLLSHAVIDFFFHNSCQVLIWGKYDGFLIHEALNSLLSVCKGLFDASDVLTVNWCVPKHKHQKLNHTCDYFCTIICLIQLLLMAFRLNVWYFYSHTRAHTPIGFIPPTRCWRYNDVSIFYQRYCSITCCTEFSKNSNIMDTCAQNEEGNLLKPNLLKRPSASCSDSRGFMFVGKIVLNLAIRLSCYRVWLRSILHYVPYKTELLVWYVWWQ